MGLFDLSIYQVLIFKVGMSVCRASVLFVLVIQTVPFAHGPLNVLGDPG